MINSLDFWVTTFCIKTRGRKTEFTILSIIFIKAVLRVDPGNIEF